MLPEQTVPEEMSHETLLKVIGKVHTLTGITIAEQKKTMLQSRLKKRMRHLSIETFEDYMSFMEKDKDEVQEFINVVTTNETSFFRTPRIWEYFQNDFLPAWHAENPKGQLKLWSAAASSGEESFSLAICCTEFQRKHPTFNFKIFASDISTEVLAEAKKGVFPSRSVEFLRKSKPQLFDQYFVAGEEDTFKIIPDLKNKVQFEAHNLFKVKKEQYDIIFLRNVLIYFVAVDQEIVLKNVGKSLAEKGMLIIGESESLNRLDTPYEFKHACIYSKKGNA
jgi:chemotaxis protein methyltransferase CheR